MMDDDVEAFRKGTWELDCPEMLLWQNTGENQLTFRGPGFIRQASDGTLEFRLYSDTSPDPMRLSPLSGLTSNVAAGELVPDTDFFTLTATDTAGREWSSSRLIPDVHYARRLILSGRFDELNRHENVPGLGNGLVLQIFDDIAIPCNAYTSGRTEVGGELNSTFISRDSAVFTACGARFTLTRTVEKLTLRAESGEQPLPLYFDKRVIEALQLILARPLQWSVRDVAGHDQHHLTLKSPEPMPPSRVRPPIEFEKREAREAPWILFDKYLSFISGGPLPQWHPVSMWVWSVLTASGGSHYSEALALGVAVEGILNDAFPSLGVPDVATLAGLENFRSHLKVWPGDDALKQRIEGAVAPIGKARPLDKLRVLEAMGKIGPGQHMQWKRLRNRSAHAAKPEFDKFGELIRDCFSVELLMYLLIFSAVGYAGPFTDHATLGWPDRSYPQDVGQIGSREDSAAPPAA